MCVLTAQLCLTLCNPIDCSSQLLVRGISQARILKWASSWRWWRRRTWVHLLLQEHQNYNYLLNNHWQENAGKRYQKRYPMPNDKKLEEDGRRGTIMIKSNPIPTRWVTHKPQNNNTKEVFPLLWRFWTQHQTSQPGDLTKGLGIPRESGLEGQRNLIMGFPQDWEKQTPALEGMNKTLHAPRARGKEQWPHRRLNQKYLLSVGGPLVEAWVSRVSPQGPGALAAAGQERPPWCKPSWTSPLTLP